MTREEISKEMQECSKRIKQLTNEIGQENDFSVAQVKIAEMIKLANKMADLDTMNKGLLLDEVKERCNKMLDKFKSRAC